VDFVEICNICTRKVIIKAAKRIFNSDKICRSYCDFYFGVTYFGTQCMLLCLLSLSMKYTEFKNPTLVEIVNMLILPKCMVIQHLLNVFSLTVWQKT